MGRIAHDLDHGLDPPHVVGQAVAADLELHVRVAEVEIAPHLVLQGSHVLARIVVAARGIDPDRLVRLPAPVAVGEQAPERLLLDLRHGIPDRHVDHAHRHRALAMAAGLLVAQEHVPNRERIQVVVLPVDEPGGIGLHQPGDEALAQEAALGVAAVGVEAIANDRPAAPDHVGDHGHDRAVHLREVDIGVADLGADRDGLLADLDDLHGFPPRLGRACRTAVQG